jgi:hypothetical protein
VHADASDPVKIDSRPIGRLWRTVANLAAARGQEIAHPTNARLVHRAIAKPTELARHHNVASVTLRRRVPDGGC